jgi:hypothetical protein
MPPNCATAMNVLMIHQSGEGAHQDANANANVNPAVNANGQGFGDFQDYVVTDPFLKPAAAAASPISLFMFCGR